jgi:hypothetical protein
MEPYIKPKRHFFFNLRALNYWPIANKLTAFEAHAWKLRGMKFHENPSNGRLHTAEKLLCSPSKVLYWTDGVSPPQEASAVEHSGGESPPLPQVWCAWRQITYRPTTAVTWRLITPVPTVLQCGG